MVSESEERVSIGGEEGTSAVLLRRSVSDRSSLKISSRATLSVDVGASGRSISLSLLVCEGVASGVVSREAIYTVA